MTLIRLASRPLALALLLVAAATAWAQTDPPARVAYVSALEGPVQLQDSSGAWAPASLNWPVTTGTQLQLDAGARMELDGGWLALRLQGPAALSATALDDSHTQLSLTGGSAALRLRNAPAGQRVELDTPQLALVATQPGEYRLNVDASAATTAVTVRSGAATVYGDAGQAMTVAAGQQLVFAARDLRVVGDYGAPPRDSLGQWAAARDAQQQQSLSATYVSPNLPGYPVLDAYGQWAQDSSYGPVWYPTVTVANWAPYRDGRWAWVAPWGWTWIDAAPWGFAPFHYGRWTLIGPRWAWVPGPIVRRPVYAPALVQFFGAGPGWTMTAGAGLPGAAWFPLAPGEIWAPPYAASPRYRERINDWGHWRGPMRPPGDGFFFQHRPGAISVAPPGPLGFVPGGHGRPPRYGDGSHLPPGWMQGSRPVAPPPRPVRPPPGMRPDFRPPAAMPPPRPMPGPGIAPPPGGHQPPPPPGLRPEFRPPAVMPPPRPVPRPPTAMPPPRPDFMPPAPPRPEWRPPAPMPPRPELRPPPRPEYRPPMPAPRPEFDHRPPQRPEFQGRPPQRPEWSAPPPPREFTRPERFMAQPARPPAHVEREAHRGPPPQGPHGGRRGDDGG